jgi:protein MpaA
VPPVKAAPAATLDPLVFAARIQAAAAQAGFRVEPYGEIASLPAEGPAKADLSATGSAKAELPLFALTKRTPGPRPRVYLSAGIHGDEPAPPLALLELIERGVFDERATWFICPLLNPVGFQRRTRGNAAGLDLNRDFKTLRALEVQAHVRWLQRQPNFDLALCLHEDWEATGYYLYELNPTQRTSLARPIVAAVEQVCPIEQATIIDGREVAERAIIRPITDPALRELWPESIYLRAHHTRLSYTLETPSTLPLAQRIAAHAVAVQTAIAAL